jgi:hypothetical protein
MVRISCSRSSTPGTLEEPSERHSRHDGSIVASDDHQARSQVEHKWLVFDFPHIRPVTTNDI